MEYLAGYNPASVCKQRTAGNFMKRTWLQIQPLLTFNILSGIINLMNFRRILHVNCECNGENCKIEYCMGSGLHNAC